MRNAYCDVLLCNVPARSAAVSLITDDINSGHSSGFSALRACLCTDLR